VPRKFSQQRRRNLNWTGFTAIRNSITAGGAIHLELYDGGAANAVGLAPVLQRIRCSVTVDPDINPAEVAEQFWTTYGIIYTNETNLGSTWDAALLSSDEIVWAGLLDAESRNILQIQGGGTDPDVDLLGQYVAYHPVQWIDVKAKRRMKTEGSVFFSLFANASNTSDVQVSVVARVLMATP